MVSHRDSFSSTGSSTWTRFRQFFSFLRYRTEILFVYKAKNFRRVFRETPNFFTTGTVFSNNGAETFFRKNTRLKFLKAKKLQKNSNAPTYEFLTFTSNVGVESFEFHILSSAMFSNLMVFKNSFFWKVFRFPILLTIFNADCKSNAQGVSSSA